MSQNKKETLSILAKVQMKRLLLTMLIALIYSTMLSLLAGTGATGVAYAASNHTQSASSTHGGGCKSDGFIEACVSVDGAGYVVPDVYVLYNRMCGIQIGLVKDGWPINNPTFGQCYSKGTHLVGSLVKATPGHNWYTYAFATINPPNVDDALSSPLQYT